MFEGFVNMFFEKKSRYLKLFAVNVGPKARKMIIIVSFAFICNFNVFAVTTERIINIGYTVR